MTLPEATRALLARLEMLERNGNAFASGMIRRPNGGWHAGRTGPIYYRVPLWAEQARDVAEALGVK